MANCPECKTILQSGAHRCPCGWREKTKPQAITTKRCPGCGQSMPLHDATHGCGWMVWQEALIRDAMQTNPRDAIARMRKADELKRRH